MRKNLTRLTQPLVRENGALRPATWDEALDRAAERFPMRCARPATRTRSGCSAARRPPTR